MGVTTCPPSSKTSFPLGIGFTPTTGVYSSLSMDKSRLEMQWGIRSTKPGFSGDYVNEEAGATTTTLRYNTNTYSLTALQISKSTHTPWLLPVTSQPLNTEDIVLTFITTSKTSTTPIIIVVIPIVRNGTARTDPLYLTALDTASDEIKGTFSLKDCLPDNNYIKYTVCIPGYTTEASSADAIVYVNTTGLSVSSTLMAAIQKNSLGGRQFPTPDADFMQEWKKVRISMTAESIKTHVSMSSSPFENYMPPSDAPPSTDNYKCMPLDMAQIQTSDLSGAKTLTQILLPEARDVKILDPGMTEYVLTIVIGVTLGIIILSVGFLTVSNVVIPAIAPAAGAAAVGGPTLVQRLYDVRFYILAGFVGVFIGGLASYFTTKKAIGK